MSKYLGVIIGAAVAVVGLIGLLAWWPEFITLLKGSIPAILILAGAIAVVAGFSEIKDEFSPKK